jgi:putative Holliday junction resolvase
VQRGRRIAFDVGTARIGVAVCDPDGILATPLTKIDREDDDIQQAIAYIEEHQAVAIYVGLPLNLEGKWTRSTFDALYFAQELEESTNVRVRLIDERLSTRAAQANLHAAGRTIKTSKDIIDSASAIEILERALEILKAGREAGKTTDAAEAQSAQA